MEVFSAAPGARGIVSCSSPDSADRSSPSCSGRRCCSKASRRSWRRVGGRAAPGSGGGGCAVGGSGRCPAIPLCTQLSATWHALPDVAPGCSSRGTWSQPHGPSGTTTWVTPGWAGSWVKAPPKSASRRLITWARRAPKGSPVAGTNTTTPAKGPAAASHGHCSWLSPADAGSAEVRCRFEGL